jgi:Ca2+-transporting ATPase
VFVVIGITLAQERKTQRALESLRDLSAPRALVIRDGQEQRIAGRDVVRGDLLVLHEGDRIAADALLIDGQLEVDESLLTGEAVPVAKLPMAGRSRPARAGPVDGGAAGAPATPGRRRHAPALFASTVVTQGCGAWRGCAPPAPHGRGAHWRRPGRHDRAALGAAGRLAPPGAQLTVAAWCWPLAQVLLGWWWNGRPCWRACSRALRWPWPSCPRRFRSSSPCSWRWAPGASRTRRC